MKLVCKTGGVVPPDLQASPRWHNCVVANMSFDPSDIDKLAASKRQFAFKPTVRTRSHQPAAAAAGHAAGKRRRVPFVLMGSLVVHAHATDSISMP